MVNLTYNSAKCAYFILLLTFFTITSCVRTSYYVAKIEGKKINVANNLTQNDNIEAFVKPYRDHIDADLNTVLAYCHENLEKSKGKFQTNIGNFLADITLMKTNALFSKTKNQTIDICILNHGGIRAILPAGNVTARNAFEVMPFENSAVVLVLNGSQIVALTQYFISEKKPHPLAGITFDINNNVGQNINIQGKPLDINKDYYVVTSDYLSNGGDNMLFFKNASQKFDLNYKLRNIMIDYFNEVDTLQINKDIRIKEL